MREGLDGVERRLGVARDVFGDQRPGGARNVGDQLAVEAGQQRRHFRLQRRVVGGMTINAVRDFDHGATFLLRIRNAGRIMSQAAGLANARRGRRLRRGDAVTLARGVARLASFAE